MAVLGASSSRWRWAVLLHPALTAMVVVVTGNHFWLDGVVAVALIPPALAVLWLARTLAPRLPVSLRRPLAVPALGH